MNKKSLRLETLNKMKSLSPQQKCVADEWLFQQLIAHPKYQHANRIGIVMSMLHEINTDPIILHALQNDKLVFVPSTEYQQKKMVFQQLFDLNQVDMDERGIRYVKHQTPINHSLDLVIVPGVVFNQNGYRIGYGGGYFDRFLSKYQPVNLSLVYDIQMTDLMTVEPHDYPVSELIIAET